MKFLYIEDGALTAAQWLRFAGLQESGSGTFRTCRDSLTMSVDRGWSQPVDATLYLE